ncbi:MAG: hypothetical protein ACXWJC_08150 [Croceibacterium sp.]
MTTTTIRLEDDLKAASPPRPNAKARRRTPSSSMPSSRPSNKPGWMKAFQRAAEERWTKMLDTGKAMPWEDARAYPRRAGPQARCSQASALTRGHGGIELAPEVFDDFDRFFDHMAELRAVAEASQLVNEIIEAVDILAHSPRSSKCQRRQSRASADPSVATSPSIAFCLTSTRSLTLLSGASATRAKGATDARWLQVFLSSSLTGDVLHILGFGRYMTGVREWGRPSLLWDLQERSFRASSSLSHHPSSSVRDAQRQPGTSRNCDRQSSG